MSAATPVAAPSGRPREALALAFQEAFTAVVRLREKRQVPSDANTFRARMKDLLLAADQKARRMGYPTEFVRISVYCVIAYLDETVLAAPDTLSRAWVGRPLQEEVFGDAVAGENFFRHLDELLSRQDSAFVADVLEVMLLCMQLGFKGRYASSDGSELQVRMRSTQDKILRIRGGSSLLGPQALPPSDESITRGGDPWLPRLSLTFLSVAVTVLLLFLLLRFLSLPAGLERVRELVA
jgi:type VI secretion system protein ImpK